MDMHCQKITAASYWFGVAVFAVWPNGTGLLVGWAIAQIGAAIAG
jgi:hypothetical protein